MARQYPVGPIHRPSSSGSGDEDGPNFIRCVDVQEPQIHEVWIFGEDGVTREVHPIAQVDVGAGFVIEFATDYLTPSWRRIPMFGVNSINGSFQWLGIPDFLSNYGPPWADNLLASGPTWGYSGITTNPNWVRKPGGRYVSVAVPWNRPVRVIPDYVCRIPENMRSAARRVCDDFLRDICTARMQSLSTFRNPIRGRLVSRRDDEWDDLWDETVDQ